MAHPKARTALLAYAMLLALASIGAAAAVALPAAGASFAQAADDVPPVFGHFEKIKIIYKDQPLELPYASCSDETDGSITPGHSGEVDASAVGRYFVTYTCADAAGNSAEPVTQQVAVIHRDSADRTPPTVTINGRAEPVVQLGDTTHADPGATCIDESDGMLVPYRLSDAIDYLLAGASPIEYACVDNSGNVGMANNTIHVVDTTKPVIHTGYGMFFTITTDEYRDNGNAPIHPKVTCADNDPGASNLTDSVSAPFYPGVPSAYPLIYHCHDNHGNVGDLTRFVSVVDPNRQDVTPPVIVLDGPQSITTGPGEYHAEPGWTCADDSDAEPTRFEFRFASSGAPGKYTSTYLCYDASFNMAAVSRTILVDDPATVPKASGLGVSIRASAANVTYGSPITLAAAIDNGTAGASAAASSIAWFDGDMQIGSGSMITRTFSPGTHVITAVVVADSAGLGQVASDPVVITSSLPAPSDTTPPSISVRASATSAAPSDAIILTADTADDSGIASVVWRDGTTQIGTGNTITRTFDAGIHTITAAAVDGSPGSNVGVSDPITITISPPPDTVAPRISISASATSGTPSDMITLTADTADDSGIASVVWRDGTTQIGTGNTITRTFDTGIHTITAVAVDGSQNSNISAAHVVIRISAPVG